MGFACPTEAQKDALRLAIRNGDISWHAFPHNAELENTSPIMLAEGIKSTQVRLITPGCIWGSALCSTLFIWDRVVGWRQWILWRFGYTANLDPDPPGSVAAPLGLPIPFPQVPRRY